MYEIIPYDPIPWIYHAYNAHLRRTAMRNRKRFASQIETLRSTASRLAATHHKDLTDQVARIRNRMRATQKGTPAIESLGTIQADEALRRPLDDGEKFLLKKAFRMASSVCHPDRGGNTEDFQAMIAAYKAGDLGSLTEFVLSRENLHKQITYWRTETLKPEIDYRRFQASAENRIAQLYMRGNTAEAIALVHKVLSQTVTVLLAEELRSLKEIK